MNIHLFIVNIHLFIVEHSFIHSETFIRHYQIGTGAEYQATNAVTFEVKKFNLDTVDLW